MVLTDDEISQIRNEVLQAQRSKQEPRLVSYGLNMESCTLAFDGDEFRYTIAAEAQKPKVWHIAHIYRGHVCEFTTPYASDIPQYMGRPDQYTVTPCYPAQQPPAPCPNCCGQEPDDLRLRDEYIKAEKEIERLQARVSELEKDQSQRCPDCKARANGDTVLVPSSDLKRLQARVVELERNPASEVLKTNAELEARIAALEADNKAAWATADRNMAERSEARERIAEIEQFKQLWAISCAERDALKEVVAKQAELIEQCEAEFFHIKKVCLSEFGLSLVNENVLSAIAAYRGQS